MTDQAFGDATARNGEHRERISATFVRPLPGIDDLFAFFTQQSLTQGFAQTERALLANLVEIRRFSTDETILCEGQSSDALYFVLTGAVEVMKQDEAHDKQYLLSRIESGGIFGEMSFMDKEPASATIRANQPCEVLVITRERLEAVDEFGGVSLKLHLAESVAVAVIRRLRALSGRHVQKLQAELDHANQRLQFLRFFGATVAMFAVASFVQKLINPNLPPSLQMLYSWGFLLLTLAPVGYFAWSQHLPIARYGLSLRNWRVSLKESFIAAALLTLLVVVVKHESEPGQPLWTWGSLSKYSAHESQFFWIAYGPHCLLQEFIGRGVIQGSLSQFVTDSKPLVPILLTSTLFGIFHFYVSVQFALLTFVISLLFGWLYARHRTLIGVTVVHFSLGLASIAVGLN